MSRLGEVPMSGSRRQARHPSLLLNAPKPKRPKSFDTTRLPVLVGVHGDVSKTVDEDAVSVKKLTWLYKIASKRSPTRDSTPSRDFTTLYKLITVGNREDAALKLMLLYVVLVALAVVTDFWGTNFYSPAVIRMWNKGLTLVIAFIASVAVLLCLRDISFVWWLLANITFTKRRQSQKQLVDSPENDRLEDNRNSPLNRRTTLQPYTLGLSAACALPRHDTSSSSFSEDAWSASHCASDDASDGTGSSSDDGVVDSITDLATQKSHIVDHLMVFVYDMLAHSDVRSCKDGNSSGSSASVDQGNEKITNELTPYGPKRTLYNRDDGKIGEEEDQEDEDDAGKRRKMTKSSTDHGPMHDRKFACPYYKRDPHTQKSSKACAGPGWYKMYRLKEHLYREHAEPLHCRRCYVVFKNEGQLTEHSRSHEQCAIRNAKSMAGFNKDQETRLKCRSTMFRAESEEHKWKIIFLILFPDTALSEIPSPYYDIEVENVLDQPERASPKPPEIQQFDAYMKRELPRIIRKALEAKIEKLIGPIQETLKNDLENIVRDCQETLTRNYMNTTQSPNVFTQDMGEPTQHQQQHISQSAVKDSRSPDAALPNLYGTDELAQYFVPPDAPFDPWPGIAPSSSNTYTQDSFSDSANYSLSTNAQNPFWDDVWLNSMSSNNMGDILNVSELRDMMQTNTLGYDNMSVSQPQETYTGKGKGKARDPGQDPDVEMTPSI